MFREGDYDNLRESRQLKQDIESNKYEQYVITIGGKKSKLVDAVLKYYNRKNVPAINKTDLTIDDFENYLTKKC
jgi:uncharacterized HAD superfamily protein